VPDHVTFAEIIRFYERSDVLEARGDVGPCAGCDKSFDVGEQFSMYLLRQTNPAYTRPGGILLCRACKYTVMTTPPPAL
jgi:hypothetical protein